LGNSQEGAQLTQTQIRRGDFGVHVVSLSAAAAVRGFDKAPRQRCANLKNAAAIQQIPCTIVQFLSFGFI
jgi:hypothetical protein